MITTTLDKHFTSVIAAPFAFRGGAALIEAPRRGIATLPKRAAARLGRRARPSLHSMLVDREGAWAWPLDGRLGPASRVRSLEAWFADHPETEVRLWMSATLWRAGDREALGKPIDSLGDTAARHGARLRYVAPWWEHAVKMALSCVSSLQRADAALVCVVEGSSVAWIRLCQSRPTAIGQSTLPRPSVAALADEIDRLHAAEPGSAALTVCLGQGLVDGARTGSLRGLVLGRLDGLQPPLWLRPGAELGRY